MTSKTQLRALLQEESASARRRREYHRERRIKATRAGLHLPDSYEFATGAPALAGSISRDAQTYVERLLPRVRGNGSAELVAALEAVTVDPGLAQYQQLASVAAHQATRPESRKLRLGRHLIRFDLWAAAAGCPEAPSRVALGIARMSMQGLFAPEERAALLRSSLGWTLLAVDQSSGDFAFGALPPRERAADYGEEALSKLLAAFGRPPLDIAPAKPTPGRRRPPTVFPQGEPPSPWLGTPAGTVVLRAIGNTDTHDGLRIHDAWHDLVGRPLPVAGVPEDLDVILQRLLQRYPHAGAVIEALSKDLVDREQVAIVPTILVGAPGCGKTSFAQDFLRELGLSFEVFPCAGGCNHGLVGTDRHWQSASPSMMMRLIRQANTASVGIVLDEVEKLGGGGRGWGLDALLPLLEPATSRSYVEKFLQAPCDVSHVVWLATANSLDGVPAPLRDRCRVIRFPAPKATHMPSLARTLMREILTVRGLDPCWALPLDGMESHALAAVNAA